MGEFELIRRYFESAVAANGTVALGIGDDCALLRAPMDGSLLAVSIDTLVEGVHFLPGTDPAQLAQRLLGAAVSDLAAMAATPAWFTLALTLPQADPQWLEPFATALAARAAELGIALVGGDTTHGPLTLTVQVHGWVQPETALRRDRAQVGDCVLVSGTLGDSRGGLQTLLDHDDSNDGVDWLRQRFYRPEPRVELAQALASGLHAGIDISDGLLADLGHILEQSGVGARIDLEQLPLSNALVEYAGLEQAQHWALNGGEDFELCLTAAPDQLPRLEQLAAEQGVRLSCIGWIDAEPGLNLYSQGEPLAVPAAGYDHFGVQP